MSSILKRCKKFRPLLAGFLVMSAVPAAAEPRDQVEANATRCAIIGDDRQWLDCYYGAAQPVRAQLGLRSVTDAQLNLVASPPAGTPTLESQAARNAVLRNTFGCGTNQDQRVWLNCFYAAAEPMRVRLGLASLLAGGKAVSIPMMSASAKSGPAEQPGARSGQSRDVKARMASYSFDKNGIFTVRLDNGQVWRQLGSDDSFARWRGPPMKLLVKISKGFWGSYNLEVSGQSAMYKVRRIK